MIKRWMIWVVGIVIGATAGYLYWYYVGCVSGSCAITSSPINSTIYGAVMGGLLVNTFNYKRKETEEKKELK